MAVMSHDAHLPDLAAKSRSLCRLIIATQGKHDQARLRYMVMMATQDRRQVLPVLSSDHRFVVTINATLL